MNFHPISIEKIADESKFFSFVLCQTQNVPLSEKLPFIVTTQNGKIIKLTKKQDFFKDIEFNYSFNCAHYILNGKKAILGQGRWIKSLLSDKQGNLLQNYQIMNFETLSLKNEIRFYYYHEKTKVFIKILPKYVICSDCLIFEDLDHLSEVDFKHIEINQIEVLKSCQKNNTLDFSLGYSFQCKFAILSDVHFFGSFIREPKSIGAYYKKINSSQYYHILDQNLLRNLKRLYLFSSL